jgi:hypothetical protein
VKKLTCPEGWKPYGSVGPADGTEPGHEYCRVRSNGAINVIPDHELTVFKTAANPATIYPSSEFVGRCLVGTPQSLLFSVEMWVKLMFRGARKFQTRKR